MGYRGQYRQANRLSNLDAIEGKMVYHLINSESHYAEDLWRLLKYDTMDALSKDTLTRDEKKALVFNTDNGSPDAVSGVRVFLSPFVDDAQKHQNTSIYIYVAKVVPVKSQAGLYSAEVSINVETIVHSQIAVVYGNGDPILNPYANPNDSNEEGDLMAVYKNRATVLIKDIVAEFNGLYLDGVGELGLQSLSDLKSGVESSEWNSKSFFGHRITFTMTVSGVSASPMIGY